MSLKVAQDSAYQGDDWWKWSIWIDGSNRELDQVKEVSYTLHPTFPNPVRTIADRSSKFRLKTSGWGVFTIRAKVTKKNGEEVKLKHQLELLYPDGTENTE